MMLPTTEPSETTRRQVSAFSICKPVLRGARLMRSTLALTIISASEVAGVNMASTSLSTPKFIINATHADLSNLMNSARFDCRAVLIDSSIFADANLSETWIGEQTVEDAEGPGHAVHGKKTDARPALSAGKIHRT
jgi:hypothetical protein